MIHKVSASKFSFFKTLHNVLKKAQNNDCLVLMPGQYNMPLFIGQSLTLKGKKDSTVIISGSIMIPKGVTVHFENIKIRQDIQILVEGNAIFQQCHFEGSAVNEGLIVCHGQLKMIECTVANAPILLKNGSTAVMNNCHFTTCHITHITAVHAHIELVACHLEDALHAVVLKENARAKIMQCHFNKQRSTQLLAQNNSEISIVDSTIEHGDNSALDASEHCLVKLQNTTIQHHRATQIAMYSCTLYIENCHVQYGQQFGLQLVLFSEATVINCNFSQNNDAHIYGNSQSALFIKNSTLHGPSKIGVQLDKQSVAHFSRTAFKHQQSIQLLLSEQANASIEQCTFCTGHQGIVAKQHSHCTLLDSIVSNHNQSAITINDSELIALGNQIIRNNGNGLIAQREATVMMENNRFSDNDLSHIIAIQKSSVTIQKSKFIRGKGMYIADSSLLYMTKSTIYDGNNTQIEGNNSTKIYIVESKLSNGRSEAIKATNNCFVHLTRSTVSAHPLQQIVMNNSSLVILDSIIEKGLQNALALTNNCDARIENCQIMQHKDTQIIATLQSTIKLLQTQLTSGNMMNINISHHSKATLEHCTLTNNKQAPNTQATHFSEISVQHSTMN
ncbi:right-handed parallel beta-helix repeat-containing protein [Bacillus ndiopicus]|uniref:right-handed parallel beta-helix repeat-containing protein n=1 Tax=Bacillus ndiopicus TaxID=1347368 RepID=UPI0005A7B205|nr:right-handed parallel beta-helix repeat-containing protein [Bacillus ndiopicus]